MELCVYKTQLNQRFEGQYIKSYHCSPNNNMSTDYIQNTARQKRYKKQMTKTSIVENEVILSSRLVRFLRWRLKHSKS